MVSRDDGGLPLSVTGKPRREVPLPSQEGKKGVMQYALYVLPSFAGFWAAGDGIEAVANHNRGTELTSIL